MILVLGAALSSALWVLLWGLNVKAIDGFMICLVLMILAAVAYIMLPSLPGTKANESPEPDPAPFT
jgi:hypothetical protein